MTENKENGHMYYHQKVFKDDMFYNVGCLI